MKEADVAAEDGAGGKGGRVGTPGSALTVQASPLENLTNLAKQELSPFSMSFRTHSWSARHVHSDVIHTSQGLEETKCPVTDELVNKTWHILKKNSMVMPSKTDEPRAHDAR